jgi:hypothetical protein
MSFISDTLNTQLSGSFNILKDDLIIQWSGSVLGWGLSIVLTLALIKYVIPKVLRMMGLMQYIDKTSSLHTEDVISSRLSYLNSEVDRLKSTYPNYMQNDDISRQVSYAINNLNSIKSLDPDTRKIFTDQINNGQWKSQYKKTIYHI